jgi:hypothetical protein
VESVDGLYLIWARVTGGDDDSTGCIEIVVLSIRSEDAAMASNVLQKANKPEGRSFILGHGFEIFSIVDQS